MKKILLPLMIAVLVSCSGGKPSAEWIEGAAGKDGRALHTLILHNMPEGGRVWFQELYEDIEVASGPVKEIKHYQGTSRYLDIPKSGDQTITFWGRPLPRHSWAPEGFVLQVKGREDQPFPVIYTFLDHPATPVDASLFAASYEPCPADFLPRPKEVGPLSKSTEPVEGMYTLTLDENGEAQVESYDDDGKYYAQVTLSKLPE